MSDPRTDDVCPGMSRPADEETTRFARLREAFHRVVDADLSRREAVLQGLRESDPDLAEEVCALLAHTDEADLVAAPQCSPLQLGPFRTRRRLGRGGMGEVWLAERVEGGFVQSVAIKRVHAEALSPELARRFLRERQILARLQHPNIAHLIDGGVTPDGHPWLAMEYVDGERIDVWCAARALDATQRVRVFAPVCEAVAFAHRNLVVHRDLKPANLLVDAEGRPRLLDFGIARLLDPVEGGAAQTVVAMTPAYAAPEQRDGGDVTTATDVYQLGRVLRELVAAAPDAAAALRGDLGRILDKAAAEQPSARYAGAAVMADDLADWLARRPPRSGIGSRRERLRKTLWQWRWPLALAASVMLAIAAGGVLALREARVAQAHEREARASFAALLSVVGSANPGRFAGREPPVGEWLIDAAARLQHDFGHAPRLLHEALGGIGHGLLNLGRGDEAAAVLQGAVAALRQDPRATPSEELGLLKLLVLARGSAAQVRAAADRIAVLAARPDADPGLAIDALGSVGGAASRLGDVGVMQAAFGQAQHLLERGVSTTAPQRENFWRQRGWAALRGMDLTEARRAFAQSRLAQDAAPDDFSVLRRAELDLLLAETALAAGDLAAATAALDAARTPMESEYPPGHRERAAFVLQQARLALLRGDDLAALPAALAARDVLRGQGEGAAAAAEEVAGVALARAGRCSEARAVTTEAASATVTPRRRAEREWTVREIARVCAGDRTRR